MKNLKTNTTIFTIILVFGLSLISCKENNREQDTISGNQEILRQGEDTSTRTYRAQISSINAGANGNRNVTGNVTLEVQGDQLHITVEASGLEPDMMHLQHLHGLKEGNGISCPDPSADNNNDGLVDITEAYDVAGVTMIPFHNNPPNMEVDTQTYPTADENGNISYKQTVDLNELRNSFNERFDWEELDFSKFTYLIHGVEENAVPETVNSVKGLPPHVTLPVGCGQLSED